MELHLLLLGLECLLVLKQKMVSSENDIYYGMFYAYLSMCCVLNPFKLQRRMNCVSINI